MKKIKVNISFVYVGTGIDWNDQDNLTLIKIGYRQCLGLYSPLIDQDSIKIVIEELDKHENKETQSPS